MNTTTLIFVAVINLVLIYCLYRLMDSRFKTKLHGFKTFDEAMKATEVKKSQTESLLEKLNETLSVKNSELSKLDTALTDLSASVAEKEEKLSTLDAETKSLQYLSENATKIAKQLENGRSDLAQLNRKIEEQKNAAEASNLALHDLMAKLDLYSRLEEFVDFGHFEMPDYLYETGERFVAEIKLLREQQRSLIKDGKAVVMDGKPRITGIESIDKNIIDGQMKMILRAFNVECDLLIGKVGPATFERTLSQIEKLANDLEKLVASKRCGISIEYVRLKYEECRVQYQYALKKRDEQEEQKLIKEQMREEAKAEREYREALAAAEKEEKLYRELLERARQELVGSSLEERALAEAKIAALEQQLAEAEAKEQRAKSLAEQTRRGHVYVISNVGSFGENVYKIGMTRRLDPLDRVKELGDASVPFAFDIHAIIFADDAPAMETALHREFSRHRVNAVNFRKEFFKVDLQKIRDAVGKIGGKDIDFKTTIAAEEYFESKRLRELAV